MEDLQYLKIELDEIKRQLAQLLSSTQKQSSKYSFYQWLDEWLELYKKPNVKPSTYRDINSAIRLHIKPYIQDVNLNELTSIDVEKCLNLIDKTRLKKFVYHIFNNSLTKAYKLKIISEDIMLNVNSVKHKYKVGRALSLKEQKDLLKYVAGTKYENVYKLYLLTGCRRSELFLLKWSDIDWRRKIVHINGTKTDNSVRDLPLFPQLKELLKSIPRQDEFVLNFSSNVIKCHFKRLKSKYKLTYSIHSLRHTFATRCLEQGISMKVVQKWLGHSRLDTTANIYTHVLTDFERKEIAKFKMSI